MAGSPGETFFPVGRIRQNQEWELLPALGSPSWREPLSLPLLSLSIFLIRQPRYLPMWRMGWDTMWVLAHSFLTGNFTPKKKSYTSACIIVYDINIVFIVNPVIGALYAGVFHSTSNRKG